MIDVNTTGPVKPEEAVVEPPQAAEVNGHASTQPLPVNGDSEPKTPTPSNAPDNSSADAVTQPQPPSVTVKEEAKSPEMKPSATEGLQGGAQDTSASIEHSTQEAPKETVAVNAPLKDTQIQQNTPQSSLPSDPAPEATMQNVAEAAPASDASAVKTDLPVHPVTDAQSDATPARDATGSVPPAPTPQNADQEMRDAPVAPDAPDAPVSSTKVSREREEDPNDEPAAKRTKVDGGVSRPPDSTASKLPTPVTPAPITSAPATPAPVAPEADGDRLTKMQHRFLVKSITSLRRMQDSRFYREPVDIVKMNIPQYFDIVKHPMDLGTIERKLKGEQYPTVQALVDDFNLMVQNAILFNGAQHLVAQEGLRLKMTFDKQLTHLPAPDVVEEKKSKKAKAPRRDQRPPAAARQTGASPQGNTFALGPEGLPLIRRDSTNADGRPKRSIHPPKRDLPYSTKPKKKKYQWELRFCQETLDELHKPKYYNCAAPFYFPVDPVALHIPSYHSIIKKPMDLSTMQTKLKTGQYENAKEFELDMRLMFKNCYRFNLVGDPTYLAGEQLEEIFERKWAQKGRYLEVHEPQPGPKVDTSDEENSEEADSDADEKVVALLQKQIAEMSRQVEAIQKRKKTPPKKVAKPKATKKDSSKSGAKDKKAAPKAKGERPRWVTYQEKQLISHGISNLPDRKMQEALRIIQNNVPSLKVCPSYFHYGNSRHDLTSFSRVLKRQRSNLTLMSFPMMSCSCC